MSADGPVSARIRSKLVASFAPDSLEIVDDSESHRGHGGWREGGETHFQVRISAEAFRPMGRVARHRAVHACLADELAGPVHALEIVAKAPGEA